MLLRLPSRSTLRALLREPLLHFVVLAALLFALNAWLAPGAEGIKGEIKVSEARARTLAENFRRTWQRLPTRPELDALVADHVREEVLVREALALGLDRDDIIVRRRLRQKMEFFSEEGAALVQPTEQELARYLSEHPDAFRSEAVTTFAQVFLDPARRGKTLDADARRLLATLERGTTNDLSQLGDRLTLLQSRYESIAQRDVTTLFGKAFADALLDQPVGQWRGPIASGYGAHLVRVESAALAAPASLASVRPLVEREWRIAKRREIADAHYEKLAKQYRIVIDLPAAAP